MAVDLLEEILPHIERHIYPQRLAIPDWKMKEGDVPAAQSPAFKDKSWLPIRVPFSWGKFDKIFWFRQRVSLPEQFAGKPLALLLEIPDGLLFVNGEPYQGLNRSQREVYLGDKARSHQQLVFAIQASSGRQKELSLFGQSELVTLNPTARSLWHALNTLRILDGLHEHGSQESRDIREIIRRTLIFLKYFKPEGEEYPRAIGRAHRFLTTTLETEFKTTATGPVMLVGESNEKTAEGSMPNSRSRAHIYSTLLRLLEEYPELSVTQGCPSSLDSIKREYPSLYRQIKVRISEGRWEPGGPFWLEPDCNISSGESIVRQIIAGKRFLSGEFGVDSETAWLPDVLGFPGSLPQIFKKAGVNNFFTSPRRKNTSTPPPERTFWWVGIDGTRILSYVPTVGVEGTVSPEHIRLSGALPVGAEPGSPALQTFGLSEAGSGITKDQIESARILKTIVGLPPSVISTPKNFFSSVPPDSSAVTAWEGEIYLDRYRGTYTTRSQIKRENRLSERHLYTAELVAALASSSAKSRPAPYPKADLREAWLKLFSNQASGLLSGISPVEAYQEAAKNADRIAEITAGIIRKGLERLTGRVPKRANEFRCAVFNSLGFQRSDYVEIEVPFSEKDILVTDDKDSEVESQVLRRERNTMSALCYIENMPPFSFVNLFVRPRNRAAAPGSGWKLTPHVIETPMFRIRLDKKGALSSLYDRRLKRELLESGKRGNLFQTFRDAPKEFEASEIEADLDRHRIDVFAFKEMKVSEAGPLRASLRGEYRSPNGSTLIQHMRLYHRTNRIDFVTELQWRERQTMLKVAFPLNLKSGTASFEIPFGAITRGTKAREDRDAGKTEVPAQRWADVSDQRSGVSLLNDCKYGYDTRANVLRLTLVRSPRISEAGRGNASPHDTFVDIGEHIFTYAIYPHEGAWTRGATAREARKLNHPLLTIPNAESRELSPLVEQNRPNIFPEAVKIGEDGDSLVIRLVEAHGVATDSTLRLGVSPRRVVECDLLEREIRELRPARGKLALKFKPYEIKTLKFEKRGRAS